MTVFLSILQFLNVFILIAHLGDKTFDHDLQRELSHRETASGLQRGLWGEDAIFCILGVDTLEKSPSGFLKFPVSIQQGASALVGPCASIERSLN